MKFYRKEESRLKFPFLVAGAAIGALAGVWYLVCSSRGLTLLGAAAIPEPLWRRLVNGALMVFAAVYGANIVRRLVEFATHDTKDS
ncbi:hypothetical protein [Geobacter pickeringii]|uniref:Uncharacterized protein n=1 Tax=Geobacter pickeringii TaxID=345632 RepID=A0A0B5BI74_9BACT|nr:hypothetical protein [Geobacter pickeringii]AJE03746.1 hypothetical protein GPICK_10630 [Geobacter pickeringii]